MQELLMELCQADAPSGFEAPAREVVRRHLTGLVDEVQVDPLGNLLAIRRGRSNRRLMLAAHLDEIGFLATHIDEKGFVRFAPIGGHDVRALYRRPVRSPSGVVGVIDAEEIDNPKDLALKHLFIDIGASSKEEAERWAPPGTPFVYAAQPVAQRGQVISKALDDRAGCAVLLSVLQGLAEPPVTVIAAFTVQEEVGLRGATIAGYGQMPDLALAIDVTPAGDTPKSRPLNVELGKGAAIKVSDRGLLAHPAIKEWLFTTAERHQIPHQSEVLPYGATDAGAIHLSRGGVPSGCVSLPLRHLHSPAERVALADLEAARALILAAIADLPRL